MIDPSHQSNAKNVFVDYLQLKQFSITSYMNNPNESELRYLFNKLVKVTVPAHHFKNSLKLLETANLCHVNLRL